MSFLPELFADAVLALKNALQRDQYTVLVDSSNGCNLRCSFCARNTGKVVLMTPGQLECILDKLHPRVASLQLSCAWEFSIAKNAADIVRTIGKYRLPFTSIYSNGNILTDDIIHALIDVRLNEFVISIGEARKETYEKLRKGGRFETVISNISRLADLKKQRGAELPVICTNLTVVNSNLGELGEFVELARSIGVKRIVGRHLILNQGLDISDEIVRDAAAANSIIAAAESKALGYGMSFFLPRYQQQLEPKSCRAPWRQLYISSNGDVSVCPRIHKYATLGNLLTDSFDSIRRGKVMRDLKKQFDDNQFSNPVCGICMENLETMQAINQGF